MATLTPVSGGSQPVLHMDVGNTVLQTANIASAGPVQPQGPKLDFFSLTANASLANEGGANEYVANVLNAIQNGTTATVDGRDVLIGGATVAFYQVGPSPAVINLAVYPTGTYDLANLVLVAQTANTASIGIPTANVSNVSTFTSLISS